MNQNIHEAFDVVERVQVIREDRFLPSKNLSICYQDKHYSLVNYATLGVAVVADIDIVEVEHMNNVPLYYDNIEVARLQLKKVRNATLGAHHLIAFEITGKPISLSKIQAIDAAKKIIDSQNSLARQLHMVPQSIKSLAYEMNEILLQLKTAIDEIEAMVPAHCLNTSTEYESAIIELVAKHLDIHFQECYQKITHALAPLNTQERQQALNFLREQLSPIIHQSAFAHRSYHKPLGYAGDYEMMNIIYRREAVGRTLFERCLQQYYVHVPAAQAVRNRADFLAEVVQNAITKSANKPLRILSVACGPAFEWQKLVHQLKDCRQQIIVDLLDQDEFALKDALQSLRQAKNGLDMPNIQFNFVNKAIRNVIARGMGNEQYDLIYSAGLFDYFSDQVARTAAQSLFNSLRPGGRLVIGNFDTENPSTLMMEYALDWYLIYRTEQDLEKLFGGISVNLKIDREPMGINLFCFIDKTE